MIELTFLKGCSQGSAITMTEEGWRQGQGCVWGGGVAAREDEGDQLGCYSICYSKKEMMVVHRSVEAVKDHTNL